MDCDDLVEIEAIKQLKYRYLRYLDTNRIDQLGDCFTEDATANYRDGKFVILGRAAILELLGRTRRVSLHTVHQPEIVLTTPDSATGTWALEDTQFLVEQGVLMHIAGHYSDTYVKSEGRWLIRSTGYTRLFEHRSPIAGGLSAAPI